MTRCSDVCRSLKLTPCMSSTLACFAACSMPDVLRLCCPAGASLNGPFKVQPYLQSCVFGLAVDAMCINLAWTCGVRMLSCSCIATGNPEAPVPVPAV